MVNRPKAIGTAAETALRNVLLASGFSELQAHRNVLKGSADEGDVWLRHPHRGLIVFEVKGGAAAKTASSGQVSRWWDEVEVEKENASANFGFLVQQRAGVGYPRAGEWWAMARLRDLIELRTGIKDTSLEGSPLVRISVRSLIKLIGAPVAE